MASALYLIIVLHFSCEAYVALPLAHQLGKFSAISALFFGIIVNGRASIETVTILTFVSEVGAVDMACNKSYTPTINCSTNSIVD